MFVQGVPVWFDQRTSMPKAAASLASLAHTAVSLFAVAVAAFAVDSAIVIAVFLCLFSFSFFQLRGLLGLDLVVLTHQLCLGLRALRFLCKQHLASVLLLGRSLLC